MNSISVKELNTTTEIMEAYPIMKQLRTHLDEQAYKSLVIDAMKYDHYKLMALLELGKIVGVIGFKPMITLYYGKFVWICDLVVDDDKRSMGYGEKLLTYVHQWAKENKYKTIALSSGIQRDAAHRFYENIMNYEKVSYVFKSSF